MPTAPLVPGTLVEPAAEAIESSPLVPAIFAPVRMNIEPPVELIARPPEIETIPPKPDVFVFVGISPVGAIMLPPVITTLPPLPPSSGSAPMPEPAMKFSAPPRALASPALNWTEPAEDGLLPLPA